MGVNSLPWYYSETLGEQHDIISLTGDEWHHCLHVLRMGAGDSLILFDGQGVCFEGIIRKTAKTEGWIELVEVRSKAFSSGSTCHINIAFAPTKNIDRTEFAVEKIVELGVDSISFLDCQNSERTHIRLDRIKKIAIGAAKQSRKLFLPQLHDLISPATKSKQSKISIPNSKILCCHLEDATMPLYDTYRGEDDVLLLIGPEGGFAPEEILELKSVGAEMTSLGPHRLRVETAVITACANIHLLHALNHTS